MTDMTTAAEAFGGQHVFDNFARLFIIFVGLTLGAFGTRISVTRVAARDWERALATLSFTFIVITPAVSGLLRFGAPINWWSSGTYMVGLALGIAALAFRFGMTPPWSQAVADLRERRRRRRRIIAALQRKEREEARRDHGR